MPGSIRGAPSSWTLAGPPEKISAAGCLAATCSAEIVCDTISE